MRGLRNSVWNVAPGRWEILRRMEGLGDRPGGPPGPHETLAPGSSANDANVPASPCTCTSANGSRRDEDPHNHQNSLSPRDCKHNRGRVAVSVWLCLLTVLLCYDWCGVVLVGGSAVPPASEIVVAEKCKAVVGGALALDGHIRGIPGVGNPARGEATENTSTSTSPLPSTSHGEELSQQRWLTATSNETLLCSTVRANTSVSRSTESECCGSWLARHVIATSDLLWSTFNNSVELGHFRAGVSRHLPAMRNYSPSSPTTLNSTSSSSAPTPSNEGLWRATVQGMQVLGEWGLKYWDPVFLLRANVFTDECLLNLVRNRMCGACTTTSPPHPAPPPPPACKSQCQNVVMECLKFPLGEFIEAPWKHAVNSVRTAVRLVITTSPHQHDTDWLQPVVSDLNEWREPITWWIHDYKHVRSCEGLPTTNCWDGGTVTGDFADSQNTSSSRFFQTSNQYHEHYQQQQSFTWRSLNVRVGGSKTLHPEVIRQLDAFRNQLVVVRKSLEKYWPTAATSSSSSSNYHHRASSRNHQFQQPNTRSTPPHALPLSSLEDRSPSHHHHHPDDLIHEGSGGLDDSFENDDEDLEEYSNNGSGYGPSIIETDDEDLLGGVEGSGSGDGPDDHDDDDDTASTNTWGSNPRNPPVSSNNPGDRGSSSSSGGSSNGRPPISLSSAQPLIPAGFPHLLVLGVVAVLTATHGN